METFLKTAIKIIKQSETGHLSCVRIANGWCMVTNSRVSYTTYDGALSHIDVTVNAKKLLAALRGCKFEPDEVKQTDKNIILRKGGFRAMIGTLTNEEFPVFAIRGEEAELGVAAFKTLKRLRPFASTDASRPWACSMYFDGTKVWATNNVTLASQPLSTPRSFILPIDAFDELVRADSPVTRVAVNEHGMRFDMENGIQFHTNLISSKWPDVASLIIPVPNAPPVIEGMKGAVLALLPLCENMLVPKICLSEEGMSTEEGSTQASFTGISFPEAIFNAKPFIDVLEVATHINLAGYPGPCYFKGNEGLEGVTVGITA